jgi:hypothetical protein
METPKMTTTNLAADDLAERLKAAGYNDSHNRVKHSDLTATTYNTVKYIMEEGRHRTYSEPHWRALYALCGTLTEVVQQQRTGRIVWPIPTGGGKSTVVLAVMLALHQLGLRHVGVVVCQNRIGSLCELRNDLHEWGVPNSKVTLVHSSRPGTEEWDSDSHDPEDARQFVLLTHNNVIDRRRLEDFSEWKGQPRLVLWDESLLTRTPRSVELRELGAAVGALRHVATHPKYTDLAATVAYLGECEAQAAATLSELRESGERSALVHFPRRSFAEVHEMREVMAKIGQVPEVAKDFLDLSQADARIVPGQWGGMISFQASIPVDVAPNVVVLDASWVCRSLLRLDSTLEDAEDLPQVQRVMRKYNLKSLADLKNYRQVEVTQVMTSGGRAAIVKKDLGDKSTDPLVLPLVVDAIAASDVPVLVYVFKDRADDRGVSAREAVKQALIKDGHGDLLAKRVEVGEGDTRWWLSFETHGNETGFNRYNHCGLVLLYGVLHDSETVVASKLAAAEANLDTDLSTQRLRSYLQSEKHHRVLQAMSRGAMRNPGEGTPKEAAPMRALIFDADTTLRPSLRAALPGIRWTLRSGPGRKRGVVVVAAMALAKHLKSLPASTREVASKTTKTAIEETIGEPIRSQTWKRVRDEALKGLPGWRASGQRLKRHRPA